MATLGRNEILAAPDTKGELVPIPVWGGEVWVGRMTGGELDQFRKFHEEASKAPGSDSARLLLARIAALVLRKETGERLFADDEAKLLAEKSFQSLDAVLDAAIKVNALGAKAVEEKVKNS